MKHLLLAAGGTYGQTKFLWRDLTPTLSPALWSRLCSSAVKSGFTDRERPPQVHLELSSEALRNEEIVRATGTSTVSHPWTSYTWTNLCAAILAAIERRVQGVINLGTGIATSTTEIAQRIRRAGWDHAASSGTMTSQDTAGNIVMDINRAVEMLGCVRKLTLRAGWKTSSEWVLMDRFPPSGNSRPQRNRA